MYSCWNYQRCQEMVRFSTSMVRDYNQDPLVAKIVLTPFSIVLLEVGFMDYQFKNDSVYKTQY